MGEEQAVNTNQEPNKKGLVQSGFGGISSWFGSLLGKRKPAQPTTGIETKIPQKSDTTATEDSVAQDIQSFKSFVGKLSTQVSKSVGPSVSKSKAGVSSFGQVIDKNFLKKLVRAFLIIFFLMLVTFIGIKLFRELGKNGGNGGIGDGASPTPVQYQPYKPSVYADDPETLKLEEDINVLERELSGTNLRETLLNPPSLDFEVSF